MARGDVLDDILDIVPLIVVGGVVLWLADNYQRTGKLLPDLNLLPSIRFPFGGGDETPTGPPPGEWVSNVRYTGPGFVRNGADFLAQLSYTYGGPRQELVIRAYLVGAAGQTVSGGQTRGVVEAGSAQVAPITLTAGTVTGTYSIRAIFQKADGTTLADVFLRDAVVVHPLVLIS